MRIFNELSENCGGRMASAGLPLYDFGTIWAEGCVLVDLVYTGTTAARLSCLGECDLRGHRKMSPSDKSAKR